MARPRVPDDVPAWLGLSAGGRWRNRGAGQARGDGRWIPRCPLVW